VPAAPAYVGGYGLTGSRGTLGSGVGGRTNGLGSVNPSAPPRMPIPGWIQLAGGGYEDARGTGWAAGATRAAKQVTEPKRPELAPTPLPCHPPIDERVACDQ
jgi:hypothetical protein